MIADFLSMFFNWLHLFARSDFFLGAAAVLLFYFAVELILHTFFRRREVYIRR